MGMMVTYNLWRADMNEAHKPNSDRTELLEKLEKLSQENVRLKQEVVRLRDIIYSKENSSMSSKLRDALRE
jgi:cell division protein FtsB